MYMKWNTRFGTNNGGNATRRGPEGATAIGEGGHAMKTLRTALAGVSLVLGGAAQAANPVSVDVFVQVQNLSIAVTSAASYNYGIQQFSVSPVQGTKFTFQNDGNASEQFQYRVDVANSTALSGGGGAWTLVTAAPSAADETRLGLTSKTTAAVAGDFDYTAGRDALTSAFQTAATAFPGKFVADAGSVNPVATLAVRDVYTQWWSPTSTAQYTAVKFVVQANAIP